MASLVNFSDISIVKHISWNQLQKLKRRDFTEFITRNKLPIEYPENYLTEKLQSSNFNENSVIEF